MKNPSTFITKDGVSDADLMRAARDMYEILKQINHEAVINGQTSLYCATRDVLIKARGQS